MKQTKREQLRELEQRLGREIAIEVLRAGATKFETDWEADDAHALELLEEQYE